MVFRTHPILLFLVHFWGSYDHLKNLGTFFWDTLYVRVQANIHTDTDPACVWGRVRPCQAQKTDISRLSIPQPGQPQARHRPSQAVTGPETGLGIISHPFLSETTQSTQATTL